MVWGFLLSLITFNAEKTNLSCSKVSSSKISGFGHFWGTSGLGTGSSWEELPRKSRIQTLPWPALLRAAGEGLLWEQTGNSSRSLGMWWLGWSRALPRAPQDLDIMSGSCSQLPAPIPNPESLLLALSHLTDLSFSFSSLMKSSKMHRGMAKSAFILILLSNRDLFYPPKGLFFHL